jgi:hypothetical protein
MALQRASGGFPAQYSGHCPECGERIEIGDMLIRTPNDSYSHAACPDVSDEKPTKFKGSSDEEMGF